MIKNIVFDIGMVLIDFHWQKTMKELGIPDEAIVTLGKNMVEHVLWGEMDRGFIPEEELVAEFKRMSPQYEEYIDLFLDNMEGVVTDYPGSKSWLKELKDRGYNIYLLSNYPKSFFEMHVKNYSFMPYVDGRVVSYEYKVKKPDVRIYEILCEKYNIKPEESVFLDDRKENIATAESLGFKGIVVTDQDTARKQLDELLGCC